MLKLGIKTLNFFFFSKEHSAHSGRLVKWKATGIRKTYGWIILILFFYPGSQKS